MRFLRRFWPRFLPIPRELNQRAFEAGYNYVKERYGAGN